MRDIRIYKEQSRMQFYRGGEYQEMSQQRPKSILRRNKSDSLVYDESFGQDSGRVPVVQVIRKFYPKLKQTLDPELIIEKWYTYLDDFQDTELQALKDAQGRSEKATMILDKVMKRPQLFQPFLDGLVHSGDYPMAQELKKYHEELCRSSQYRHRSASESCRLLFIQVVLLNLIHAVKFNMKH